MLICPGNALNAGYIIKIKEEGGRGEKGNGNYSFGYGQSFIL